MSGMQWLVIWLGAGGVTVFYDWHSKGKHAVAKLDSQFPNVPPTVIAICVALVLAFAIITWPWWAVANLYAWSKRKGARREQ